jgi:hypothetical protein
MMDKILEWMSPTRWAILLCLVLALLSAFLGYGEWRASSARTAEHDRMQVAIDQLKIKAAGELAAETRAVLSLERKLAQAEAKEQADYEKRRMDSRAASMALDRAAADHGGMFVDPHGRGCGRESPEGKTAGGAASGAVDPPRAGGELSVQLSDLLRARLRRADEINDAYALCRADAMKVRELFNVEEGSP